MLSRLKFDLSETISTMLEYIPESVWTSKKTTFCDFEMGGGQFITAVVEKLKTYGHSDKNIQSRVYGFSENELYLSYVLGGQIIGTFDIYKENKHSNMKFDVIVGNPPYQIQVGPNKTEPIWHKFVQKSFNHLNEGGYLSLIHPSGWRNIDGRFKKIQKLLLSKQIYYLEMHNINDGIKTFGAETRYDWYILKNQPSTEKTHIRFEDGSEGWYDISNMDFIPNYNIEKITALLAKKNEETVEVLYSCDYHTQHSYISREKTDGFIYPIISLVRKSGETEFMWSNIIPNDYFSKPKIVWSNTRLISTGYFIDNEGAYGLNQFNYAIVDNTENLEKIKKSMQTQKFIDVMSSLITGGFPSLNYKILKQFRKDFWKEFI